LLGDTAASPALKVLIITTTTTYAYCEHRSDINTWEFFFGSFPQWSVEVKLISNDWSVKIVINYDKTVLT